MKFPCYHPLLLLTATFLLSTTVTTAFVSVEVPTTSRSIPHQHILLQQQNKNVLVSPLTATSHRQDDNDNISSSWSLFSKSPVQAFGATLLSMFLLWNSEGVGGNIPMTPTTSTSPMITTTTTTTTPFKKMMTPPKAMAIESKVVGELKGSGLVFKDTLQVERFEDPKVKGVVLYISNFQRPITEKLSGKNFLNDPSSAGISCAKTGPIAIADNIARGSNGEEVFQESRSLLFKTLRVQRIFDEDKNTIVYVSFSTRLDKNDDSNSARFTSTLCAVNLNEPEKAAPAVKAAE